MCLCLSPIVSKSKFKHGLLIKTYLGISIKPFTDSSALHWWVGVANDRLSADHISGSRNLQAQDRN